jgi:hypothetical protein
MSFIRFPLRLEGDTRQSRRGGLVRCDELEAMKQLLEIIANTPAESWAVDKRFGFPFFMGLSLSQEGRGAQALTQQTVRNVNLSLEELGVRDFRVESIVKKPVEKFGEVRYDVVLRSTANNEIFPVEISGTPKTNAV